jgi:four helix bundle protein
MDSYFSAAVRASTATLLAFNPKEGIRMMTSTGHRDLIVWQRSVALARNVYAATANAITGDTDDLAMQIRRSAVSIASTIAEGSARPRRSEFRQLLGTARGVLSNLEAQVMIATDLRIVSGNIPLEQDISELRQLLATLIRKLSEQQAR